MMVLELLNSGADFVQSIEAWSKAHWYKGSAVEINALLKGKKNDIWSHFSFLRASQGVFPKQSK